MKREQPISTPVNPATLAALIGALHNRNGAVRQHARDLLVAIGEPALDSLEAMSQEPGYLARW